MYPQPLNLRPAPKAESSTQVWYHKGGCKGHLVLLQEGVDVVDHLVVMHHVCPISIQRAVRIKRDQLQAMHRSVHLQEQPCLACQVSGHVQR